MTLGKQLTSDQTRAEWLGENDLAKIQTQNTDYLLQGTNPKQKKNG